MRRFVVGAAVALLLAGCGGDPKADPSPNTSASPSASAAPTPTAPVMPEAAKANTKAGAIAFVKYYVELINYVQATGDTATLDAFDSPQCRSCENARKSIEGIYRSGGHIEGGALQADVRSSAPRPDVSGWTVFANVRYGRQRIVQPNGTKTLKGGQSILTFVVKRSDTWSVLEWSRG